MADYAVGQLIENRYRVKRVIGKGGMGVLYCVTDEAKDNQTIALKTIRLDDSDEESRESIQSFQREFRVLSQLRHPNLVSVYEYGLTTRNEFFFTMEWVDGVDLDVESGRKPLAPGDILPVMVQLTRALAYLHARGVIHGDLKPSNVLITPDGKARLVDFGVALETRSVEARARYYTPGYAAPEVKLQQPVDRRIDLYSLGAIWFALLTGGPPLFQDSNERLIGFTLKDAINNLPGASNDVVPIIARLLAHKPQDRFASANQVIEAIGQATGSPLAFETSETAGSYALRVQFVDRQAEFETISGIWEETRLEKGKILLIGGEAGVGKTRLLEELELQAELQGARVVWGQCIKNGGGAYHPWREVLRVLVRYVEVSDPATLQRTGPILTAILPELWQLPGMAGLTPPATLNPAAAQQRLNDAVAQLLIAAAQTRPTVTIIENAHWADEASLALLTSLARIPDMGNLLVCITYRREDAPADHPLSRLDGAPVKRILLERLDKKYTTELVQSMLGMEELPGLLSERVQKTTGGNAFFVQELVRALAVGGQVLERAVDGWRVNGDALHKASLPESIQQVIQQRLDQLPVETQQALRWGALMGQAFWPGGAARAGEMAPASIMSALAPCLEQGLLALRDETSFPNEPEYIFLNETVQQVSYGSIPGEQRQAAHAQVVDWLLANSDVQAGEHLGLIASHLEQAGQTAEAIPYLRQAGEQAAARFAHVEAIGYLTRALDLIPADQIEERYAVLLAREGTCNQQGARETQRRDLAELEKLAITLADPMRQTEIALRRSNFAEVTGDYAAAISAAETAIRLASAAGDMAGEATGCIRLGQTLWHREDYPASRLQLERALGLVRQGTPATASIQMRKIEADSLRNLGTVSIMLGDYIAAQTHYEQSRAIYQEIGDKEGESRALNNLGNISLFLGFYETSQACYEQALQLSHQIGHRWGEGVQQTNLALLYHSIGKNPTAHDYSQRALTILREVGDLRLQGYALTHLGHALEGQGLPVEASQAYQQALEIRRSVGQNQLAMDDLAGLAQAALDRREKEKALAYTDEILRHEKEYSLTGAEDIFRVYLTCYRVLSACQDPRAAALLATAHRLLQERADKISQKKARRSLLENVPAHREIVAAFSKGGKS